MGSLLFSLFLVFIVIPIVRTLWTLFSAKRKFDNFRRQAQQAYEQQFGARNTSTHDNGSRTRQRTRGKKINADVGEYVSFEELPRQTDRCDLPPRQVVAEEQIVDVEWEDIK